tara:strand:- start:5510 stop:6433 length:924 start_codon:yes stop_codon:yes gene_type:complete
MSSNTTNSCFEPFKAIHKNQTLYIIGNGPSLNETDLDLIKNSPSIAMNRISMIYPNFPEWRPTYYLFCSSNISNPIWGEEWLQSVINAVNEKKTISFIDQRCLNLLIKKEIKIHPNIKLIKKMSENKPNIYGDINPKSFSTNILESIDKSGTTINVALQIAYYLEPKEIIFLGADLGWTANNGSKIDQNHFDKTYKAHIPDPIKTNFQMRNVHKLSKEIFNRDKPKINFYNASKKTKLDVYPIIDFEKYAAKGVICEDLKKNKFAKDFWKNIKKGNRFLIKIRYIVFRIKLKIAKFKIFIKPNLHRH